MKTLTTLFFCTILTLCACSHHDSKPQMPILNKSISELKAVAADRTNSPDSISQAILLTALKYNSCQQSDAGMAYIDSLLELSSDSSIYADNQTDLFLSKAFLCVHKSTPDSAKILLEKALQNIETGLSPQMIIQRYACAAFICRMLYTPESVDMCYDVCQMALPYIKKYPDADFLSDIYNYLAWAQNYKGLQKESLESTRKAINIARKKGNFVQEAWGMTVLCWGFRQEYMSNAEMTTALHAYNLAKRDNISMEIDIFAARVLGWAYEDCQNADSAIYYYNEAIELSNLLGDSLCANLIKETDLLRVETQGCRQPDSLSAIRSERLNFLTDLLVEDGMIQLREKEFEPVIEQEKHRFMLLLFSTFALVFAFLILSQLIYYFFKKYRKQINKTIDEVHGRLSEANANLEEERSKLQDTSSRLNEVSEQLQSKDNHIAQLVEESEKSKTLIVELQKITNRDNISLEDIKKDPRQFTKDFMANNPRFEANLKERLGNLSNHDALLCILIALRVTKEEAVNIFNIRMESMNVARHRLRTKLALTRNENLEQVLRSML